ncbi:DUF3806 domain-containing protein [Teredinibacter haidensis]|uniref:DUF3806 domain-containing protein n=1 Tax=Teredinibacter haidensis TaxID=2731755 RepID=UPI0009489806|nr:DUF3806 domain-containing protein [Teredinibacter haidensis]
MKHLIPLLVLFLSLPGYAVDSDIADKVLANSHSGPKLRPLNWLNQNFMDKQRKSINALTATHFGKQLQGDSRDILLLQRLVNEQVIETKDTLLLQALGVVLGDVLVTEQESFQWVVFEDDIGATQAVCVNDSTHCIFPITMLSRRMEVGLKPDVHKIFNSAIAEMYPYLPKVPYSAN